MAALTSNFAGVKTLVTSAIFFIIYCLSDVHTSNYEFVTCGSVLKLMNVRNQVRLHSHEVKYGSGSGQQSVTAVDGTDDHNSYWQVRAKVGAMCQRGAPVNCSQQIRLTHVSTKKNLHSHHFVSPLSHNQEVSAFGDNGLGDEGDNWSVICTGSDNYWSRRDTIMLRHSVTAKYLYVSGDMFGRPIHGQREVSCYHSATDATYWRAAEGIFVKPNEDMGAAAYQNAGGHDGDDFDDHDEL